MSEFNIVNELMNLQGRYRAARAAKKSKTKYIYHQIEERAVLQRPAKAFSILCSFTLQTVDVAA